MLEALGLVMHRVPAVAEEGDQERFDQPVPPQHLQRRLSSRLGEGHSLVRQVLQQSGIGQSLYHAAHRRCRQRQGVGDAGGRGRCTCLGEVIDRLEVVLA